MKLYWPTLVETDSDCQHTGLKPGNPAPLGAAGDCPFPLEISQPESKGHRHRHGGRLKAGWMVGSARVETRRALTVKKEDRFLSCISNPMTQIIEESSLS